MRYLGVDPGGRRVGVALGDSESGVVTPVAIVPYTGASTTAETLAREAARMQATVVVVGLPTGIDGEETPACRRSRALAAALEDSGLATVFQPERLTTFEARERAHACGRRSGEPVDDLAALVLLEEFLATSQPDRDTSADPP